MSFLAPAAFFLGLLLPVIVALYLLKLRRAEREVSSVYLWRKMVRDVEANAPWQRLRPSLLMILQLLFILAMMFALTRPFIWSEGLSGEAAILIIDSSASMSAVDSQPSRLEAARARARQLVNDLPDTARVTIIEAGQEAAVRLSSSRDRRQAHLALDSIRPGSGGSDLTVALELASAIAARQPGTEIVVLSDGRVELPKRLAVRGRLRYLPVGSSGENQAVSLLNLEPRPSGALAAFIQVSNYGSQPAARTLSVYADGQMVNAYDLSIPAGGEQPVLVEDLPASVGQVEARLDGSDLLPVDDRAVAVPPAARKARVTLVTPGNLFLQTALDLLPGVDLLEVAPDEYTGQTAADLTIFDSIPSPETLPGGALLFIAPTRSTALFNVTGTAKTPTPRAVDTADPLLQNVSLAGINVLDASALTLPDWAAPVVAGDTPAGSTPLLFRGEADGRRVAVLAFDLRHSDLPLQPAFPLLWANLTGWLLPGMGSEIPTRVVSGEPVSFNLPEGQSAQITRPDGTTVSVQSEGGRVTYADTTALGVYTVNWGEGQRAQFAVNLFSPAESSLKPADSLAGLETQGGTAAGGPLVGMREYWRFLAFLALGLLVGEWLVYQRAALARIKDWLKQHLRR